MDEKVFRKGLIDLKHEEKEVTIHQHKKPADGMLPSYMKKGIKSFVYYLSLVTLLWILWSYENVFIDGKTTGKLNCSTYENNEIPTVVKNL